MIVEKGRIRKSILVHVALVAVALVYVFPLMWMVATALKTQAEFQSSPLSLFPSNPQWYNFIKVTEIIPFFRYTLNTVFLAVLAVVGTVLSCSLVGYSFAKLRWPGRDVAFFICIATMMLPAQALQIPTFILYSNLGLYGTYMPIILPFFLAANAFSIFLLRQFYRAIPKEINEAAKIDGASEFSIYLKMMLPLILPILAAIGIFAFLASWNDFFNPLIYLDKPEMYTLPLGLRDFQNQKGNEWDMMMAGAILSMIPTVIFIVFSFYFCLLSFKCRRH